MSRAITVRRMDHTAAELREFAAGSRDGAQVRRLLALALTLEGGSRTQAAEQLHAAPGSWRMSCRDQASRILSRLTFTSTTSMPITGA